MAASSVIPLALLHADDAGMTSMAHRLGSTFPDLVIAASSSSWEELAALPDIGTMIVLVDAQSPHARSSGARSTVDTIRAIRLSGARAIVLDAADDPKAIIEYMAAGADAALKKSESSRRVADQIRLAANRAMLIRARAGS